jgi:hypothetical protein
MNEDTSGENVAQKPTRETHMLAIVSLVLGILGLLMLLFCGFVQIVVGIGAAVCGHIALSKIKSQPETWEGRGFALAGTILGYANVVLFFLAILFIASRGGI